MKKVEHIQCLPISITKQFQTEMWKIIDDEIGVYIVHL